MYYVGLLAGGNSPPDIALQDEKRAINRHNYTLAEVEQALARPVVQRLCELIRFRNRFPAFQGGSRCSSQGRTNYAWRSPQAWCRLIVDLTTYDPTIEDQEGDQVTQVYKP